MGVKSVYLLKASIEEKCPTKSLYVQIIHCFVAHVAWSIHCSVVDCGDFFYLHILYK